MRDPRFTWKVVVRGKRWRCYQAGKIVGYVAHSFNTWDAYIMTGKKWPDGQRRLHPGALGECINFWRARWAVEGEVSNA